jgi:hypothetical protein
MTERPATRWLESTQQEAQILEIKLEDHSWYKGTVEAVGLKIHRRTVIKALIT